MLELRQMLQRPLHRRDGLELDEVTVVSCYGSRSFFEALADLGPRRVSVVLDVGTSPETVADIRRIFRRRVGCALRLAMGRAPRLMHSKLFYCTWTHARRKTPIRTAHIGSANATGAGFLPKGGNAETLLSFELTGTHNRRLIDWFHDVRAAIETVSRARSGRQVEVPPLGITMAGGRISIAGFTVTGETRPPDTFDAWLQRGVLCREFQRVPDFLSFNQELRKSLPIEGPVGESFKDAGLIPPGGFRSVRHAYMRVPRRKRRGDGARWRSAWLVPTTLGYWTPLETHLTGERAFVMHGAAEREAVCEDLVQAAADAMNDDKRRFNVWTRPFLKKLNDAAELLRERDADPSDWLRLHGTGVGIDRGWYRARCHDKLRYDASRAADPVFRARFRSGFEFPELPRFQLDERNWQRFRHSFAEEVALQLHRHYISLVFAQCFREVLERRTDDPQPWVTSKQPAAVVLKCLDEGETFRAVVAAYESTVRKRLAT